MPDEATRQVLAEITADPGAPMRLGVVAPGGYGKSAILREVERVYQDAGESVRLVDDAHLLDETRLREVLDADEPRLVVAYRPWPRQRVLAESAGRWRALMPSVFSKEQVKEFLPASAGRAVVDFVHQQTGGVPRFVERLAGISSAEVPADAVAAFRPELDWLDGDLQKFLLAAEAGAGLRLDLLGALLGKDFDEVGEVIEAGRATGLLGQDGTLVPLARRAVAVLSRAERRIAVRQRLAELQLASGGPVLDLVRPLIGTGVGGPGIAAAFEAAAGEAMGADPALV
ncbi:LuxR family transcriptional regulator, partial [Umezawaea endophytica]